MRTTKIALTSFLSALGVAVYTLLVAFIMQNGERWFGQMKTIWGPASFLLLFVLSATIVGLLVLGRPVYMYFNGQKETAVKLLLTTVGWLFVFTVLALASQLTR